MRLFHLLRTADKSGVSGIGVVAEGVVFSDGSVSMRWLTSTTSTTVYRSIEDVETIHGHDGNSQIVWRDQLCSQCGSVSK